MWYRRSCTARPTKHLFELVNMQIAGVGKNSIQRCYANLCELSTAAVHNCRFLQPNPAQTLVPIAVPLKAAEKPAIFTTNSLQISQRIS